MQSIISSLKNLYITTKRIYANNAFFVMAGGLACITVATVIIGAHITFAGGAPSITNTPSSGHTPIERPRATAATIDKQTYTKTFDTTGVIKAEQETQLAPKATGRIHTLNVDVGDEVYPDMLIAQVSGEESHAKLLSAQRSHDNIDTQYENTQSLMDAHVDNARAQLDTVRANLEVSKQIRSSLDTTAQQQIETADKQIEIAQEAYDSAPAEEKDIKQKQIELAREQRDALMAELDGQKAQLDKEIDAMEEQVDVAEAGVTTAEKQRDVNLQEVAITKDSSEDAVTLSQILVENTKVYAPYYGTVVDKHVEIGTVVGAGQPVVTVASNIHVASIDVADTMIGDIALGQQAEISVDGHNTEYQARVSKIEPDVDPVSRTFNVELTFVIPPHSIRYGQAIDVRLRLDEQATGYFVPRELVYASYDGPYIIEKDGTKHLVEIQSEHDDVLEIFYIGIEDGVELTTKEL